MSLEQASFLAQIISAVAVIASLIFVGVQLGQNTKAVRASTSQAHSASYHAIVSAIIEDEGFARILHERLQDPERGEEIDWVRFVAWASSLFRFYESSRVQWLRGQLDDEHWQTIEQQVTSLAGQPGIQAWWALRRHWHSDAFQVWFESLQVEDGSSLYQTPARPQDEGVVVAAPEAPAPVA